MVKNKKTMYNIQLSDNEGLLVNKKLCDKEFFPTTFIPDIIRNKSEIRDGRGEILVTIPKEYDKKSADFPLNEAYRRCTQKGTLPTFLGNLQATNSVIYENKEMNYVKSEKEIEKIKELDEKQKNILNELKEIPITDSQRTDYEKSLEEIIGERNLRKNKLGELLRVKDILDDSYNLLSQIF